MMRSRLTLVVVGSLLFLPSLAGAEGTACGSETVIVPDGRITTSTIPVGVTFFYKITSRVGSAYSAEFHNVLGPAVQTPGTLTVYSDTGCSVTVTPTNTAAVDPGDVNGARVSFTSTTPQTIFTLNNGSGGPLTYSFTVSDTTMFSPAWSTNGTYDTFYSLHNTTNATCTGTLTLRDTGGAVVTTAAITVASGATTATNTVALGTVRNTTGTARLTHNCPPGGILAEAAIANFTISPTPYFQFIHFQSVRGPIL